ncbi:SMI1/KNR4 family protein [Neobacillus cucumis]|uniref:SMI1/KNR4 family protein n=1 Tax=Neobacillus cucumis TaxID=1740721 RepID=UPI0020408093|nr:SMI1/KNR4 family protein [Neobacillus cucumis]MCM3724619.1 SMI1/KNR4 family protein [Neobacillus cucumis]
MLPIRPNNKKLHNKKLSDFEDVIGYKLPQEYIDFLTEYNGGDPENTIIELPNSEILSIAITDLFGIGIEKINDLKTNFKIYKEIIPKGYIPIARTEGGNLVCLAGDNGHLFFWDHEIDDIENKDLLPIANNFEDFLEMIKSVTGEDLEDYEVEEVWVDPDFLAEMKKNGLLK